jgi:Rps23 Pro-64 3,4-dihydroxylase Tpa1-like proline 4-hydroxylase
MPPYRKYRNFLDVDTHSALIAWAIKNEASFKPTLISGGKLNPSQRISLSVLDFGPIEAIFRERVLDLAPALIRDLRVTPFEPSNIELELVANNDGAFFKPHIDTFTGNARKESDRVFSAVYYFYTEPRAFSGGALRLYPFGAKENEGNFVDIQPEQNTLLVFLSWAWHEVLPVTCPSRRFSDSRFTVNCWVHRSSSRSPSPV